MNLIPFIAEKLGVEMGEKFKIENVVFYLHERGLMALDDRQCSSSLVSLLIGDSKITKIPFRPKIGEDYIYIESVCQNGYIITYRDTNQGKFRDYERIKIGNCFKSRDEAENGYPELEKYIKEGVDY